MDIIVFTDKPTIGPKGGILLHWSLLDT